MAAPDLRQVVAELVALLEGGLRRDVVGARAPELRAEQTNLRLARGRREDEVREVDHVEDEVVRHRRVEDVCHADDEAVRTVLHDLVVRLEDAGRGRARRYPCAERERHLLVVVVERVAPVEVRLGAVDPVGLARQQRLAERVGGEACEGRVFRRVVQRRTLLSVALDVGEEE